MEHSTARGETPTAFAAHHGAAMTWIAAGRAVDWTHEQMR
jgi:hypothetical protein